MIRRAVVAVDVRVLIEAMYQAVLLPDLSICPSADLTAFLLTSQPKPLKRNNYGTTLRERRVYCSSRPILEARLLSRAARSVSRSLFLDGCGTIA
jgi:hypothetical protein